MIRPRASAHAAFVVFLLAARMLNPLCFALAPVAILIVCGYSYTKRFTALSQLVLGLSLAVAPVGAWLAILGRFGAVPLALALAVVLGGRRRISDGKTAQHELTNYQHIEQQSNSIRNQSSGPFGANSALNSGSVQMVTMMVSTMNGDHARTICPRV